jgi:flagellar motor switch protein FliG
MSRRAASMLKEDMEYMGPIRTKDIEASQADIVKIIRHLEKEGDIIIARCFENEYAIYKNEADVDIDIKLALAKLEGFEDNAIKELLKKIDIVDIYKAFVTQNYYKSKIIKNLSFFRRCMLRRISGLTTLSFTEIKDVQERVAEVINSTIQEVEVIQPVIKGDE